MADSTEEILTRNEALAKLVATRERDLEIQKRLNEIARSRQSNLQLEADFYEKQVEFYRTVNVQIASYMETAKAEAELRGDQITDEQLLETIRSQTLKDLDDLKNKTEDLTKAEKDKLVQLELIEEALKDGSASAQEMIENISELGDQAAQLKRAKKAADELGKQFGETAANILGINNNWREGTLTGRILNAVDEGASLADSFEAITENMKETLNPTNLLGSAIVGLVKGSIELTKQLDRSYGEFNQVTGGGKEYLDVISDVTSENYAFGISTDEAMAGVSALYTELAMFSSMSKEARTELGDLSAKLQVLGVDAMSTAVMADTLMQSVGHTKDEFVDFQRGLKSMSKEIKVPMGVLSKQFAQASEVIGQYGKQGTEEFRKLAAAAKATGIEMSSLLNIAGQFDTFESASEQVGQLNAILGGAYFDTVQMVNATEEERIDLLRRGVQASGKSFDQLGRFEKKAIAAAAGIQDINEANKLFSKSNAAYEELQMFAKDASMSLSDLSEEAFNTLSPMEKFQAVLRKFQKPLGFLLKGLDFVATILYEIVDGIESVLKWFGMTGEQISITMGIVMLAMFKFGAVIKFILGLIGLLGSAIVGAGGFIAGLVGTIGSAILSFGGFITGLGGFIGSIGAAIAGFAASIGPVLIAIGVAIKGFALAALAAAPGIALLGAAVAAVGWGIGKAASGIAQLVSSFKDLSGDQISGAFDAIGISLAGIALAIPLLLKLLPALGLAAATAIFPLIGMSMVISSIAESLMMATPFIQALGTLMAETSKMTPQAAKAAQDVMVAATNLAKVEVDNNNAELIKAIAALNSSVNQTAGGSAATGGGGGNMEVSVNIDGKEVYRRMRPYYEADLKGKIIV